jgi:hypothetical protein
MLWLYFNLDFTIEDHIQFIYLKNASVEDVESRPNMRVLLLLLTYNMRLSITMV